MEDLSSSDTIEGVFDEKTSVYKQELKSSVETEPLDQLKYLKPTLNTQITLGYCEDIFSNQINHSFDLLFNRYLYIKFLCK